MRRKPLVLLLSMLVMFLMACGTLQINIIYPAATPQAVVNPATQPAPAKQQTLAPVVPPTVLPTPPQPAASPTFLMPLRLDSGERVSIQLTRMFTADDGWAIGHGQASVMDHLLRTSDGGVTWIEVTPPRILAQNSLVYHVAQAFFSDRTHAWTLYSTQDPSALNASAIVWSTSDGGLSWTDGKAFDYGDLPQDQILPAHLGFSDLLHGWFMVHMGAGMSHDYVAIFTTEDGGIHWKRVVDPTLNNLDMACTKTGIVFNTAENGWVTGNCGGVVAGVYVSHTTDSGATWSAVNLPAPLDLQELFASPENICSAEQISFSAPQAGRFLVRCNLPSKNSPRAWLYNTRDWGRTWTAYDLPEPYGNYVFTNGQNGWWLGSANPDGSQGISLFSTTDSGLTWLSVLNPGWIGPIDFIDAQTGWVVAKANGRTAFVTSTNGGKSWKEIRPVVAP
jgi:photosystem II stability/assembly factor-like uncharacterized protein